MKVIEGLVQGSAEWHAHRLNHFNASDAPAMMGCSPYKTRAQLVKEVATGLTEEVDAQTQRLFDDGHRTEALARPHIAEPLVGEDLFPVVATNGALSASFDGLTMDDRTGFECKRLNKRLRDAMFPGCTGADLPMDYQVQMEHQHAVNEACERTLFVAAQFDEAGNLVEERHCWYTPNMELRGQVLAGWKQFEADVAAYQPAEVVPTVVAEPVEALPAVLVKVSGEIAITANFATFEAKLRDFLENRLIREPKTDQDFADLDLQIKAMKGAEAALESAEAQMLAQIASVDTAKRTKDMLHKLVRDNRLMAEKLLASEKDRRKAEIVTAGQAELREHVRALVNRVRTEFSVAADFAGAIKGKKSLASMEDAISTELARAKIEANRIADLIDVNRKAMEEADAVGLFPDFGPVCTKPADDFAALIAGRRALAAERLERERERIRAEEAARLERQQRAEAERQARELQEARERSERAEAEAAEAKRHAEAATAQAATAAPAPVPEVVPLRAAPAANEDPTLSLGEINQRIAPLTINAAGMASLGFQAKKVKASCMYRETDWPVIHRALVSKLNESAPQRRAA